MMAIDMEDGALLPSPTRDKLMPTIPKSKEDESYNSQRGSPKKSAISRHGSPQKGSPQKQSMQKKTIKQSKHHIWLPNVTCNSTRIKPKFINAFHHYYTIKQIDRNRLGQHLQMQKVLQSDKLDLVALHRPPPQQTK